MKKEHNRLDSPIFLNYDVNLTPIKISRIEMLEVIKEYFEKNGFKKTGKIDNRITILIKKKK